MAFHRLSNPSYFFTGGVNVPAGYDKLNDPSDPSVGGAGTSAPVDAGKKSSGVNAGTYFFAFGEDATTAHNNRGLTALAENTDILDNVVMASIPRISGDGPFTNGTATASFTAADHVFVGTSGTTNSAANRYRLVRVVDDQWNEIELSGAPILVTAIHNGSNVNVVGTTTDGFYVNPTFSFSPSVPANQPFRVVYGVRTSVKEIGQVRQGAPYSPHLDLMGAIRWELRKVLRELHAPSGQLWNTAWDATIRGLASAGLNERYRRATTPPAGFSTGQYNDPGNGAAITRDGRAVEIITPDLTLNTASLELPDPVLASYRVTSTLIAGTGTWPVANHGNNVGLYQEATWRSTSDLNERARSEVTGPLLLETISKDIRVSTLGGAGVLTRITATATATANPDAGSSVTAKCTIQVASGDFVHNGSDSALRFYSDLIEVTDVTTGAILGTYHVNAAVSSTRITLVHLPDTNGSPDFGTAARSVRLRWLQTTVAVGGGTRLSSLGLGAAGYYGLFVAQEAQLTDNLDSERTAVPAAVFLAKYGGDLDTVKYLAAKRVVAWGAFASGLVRQPVLKGHLLGDGGIESLGGRVSSNLFCHRQAASHPSYAANTTFTINPEVESHHVVRLNGQAAAVQLTVALNGSYAPVAGDKIKLVLELMESSDNRLSVVWPADFKFTGGDEEITPYNESTHPIYIHYEFEYSFTTADGNVWFATRRDYI